LPAALAAVLLVMLLVQLILPVEAELPAPELRAWSGPTMLAAPETGHIAADPGIVAHNLFAPGRSENGAIGKVPGTALGGIVVAGTLGTGARQRAVIVNQAGAILMLACGQRINDWQLVRLFADHAEFQRGTDKLETPYGGSLPQATAGERTEQ